MPDLSLREVIHQGMRFQPELTELAFDALMGKDQVEWRSGNPPDAMVAQLFEEEFASAGSNTFLPNREHVEIVRSVARKLDAELSSTATIEEAETAILRQVLSQAWEGMSEDERRRLLLSLDLRQDIDLEAIISDPRAWAKVGGSAALLGIELTGFLAYRLAVVAANMIARAVLNRGLSLAANAALTRGIGIVAGPIGWIALSAWTIFDLAGPAYRKVMPAAVFVAAIRQALISRYNIGVVGDGSAGKDSLLKAVLSIDTKNIHALAGSTRDIELYPTGSAGVEIANFPGFNDLRDDVEGETRESLHLCRIFLLVVDASRGLSAAEKSIAQKVLSRDRPLIVCLNKWDVVRERDRDAIRSQIRQRLGLPGTVVVITTAFDPLPELSPVPLGVEEVRTSLRAELQSAGVATDWIGDLPRSA